VSAATEAGSVRRRRAGRVVAGGTLAVVAAGAAAWALTSGPDGEAPAASSAVPLGSAAVERRDLVDRQDVSGTLGFAATHTVAAPAAGTITRLRGEGAIVRRGRSLLSIDAEATGWVLYGTRPMYRDLGPGVSDGGDVRQLERNLVALGYDPGTVDADWTSATTAAVEEFQEDRGLTEDGTLSQEEVVISDGPLRVGTHKAERGDDVRPASPVTQASSTTPVVTADVDAGLASSVHRGDAVEVTMPDGRTLKGAIARVGSVATAATEESSPTVEVRATLSGRRRAKLDGAPVTLSVATGETKDALAVPVTALVATAPSTYAVELAGSHRRVPVEIGAFADGWVQVTGEGITEGARVVVPR
jgi:peptidoglycan hydrolase-like protein with peptidoglycan-binding domain